MASSTDSTVNTYPDWWANFSMEGLAPGQLPLLDDAVPEQCPACGRHSIWLQGNGEYFRNPCKDWTEEAMQKRDERSAQKPAKEPQTYGSTFL